MRTELARARRLGAVTLPGLPAAPRAPGKLLIVNKGVPPGSALKAGERANQSSLMTLDLQTGRVTKRLGLEDQAHEIAIGPGRRFAAIPHFVTEVPRQSGVVGSGLTLVDLKTDAKKVIALPGFTGAHGLEWLDADRVAVTTDGKPPNPKGFILEVNVRTGKIERTIETNQLDTHLVRLSKDKKTYFATDLSGTFTAIDRTSGQVIKKLRPGAGTEGFDLSPDGKEIWVAAAGVGEGRMLVLDARTLERKASFEATGYPIRVLFTRDGKHVLVSNWESNDVSVIDTRTRAQVTRIKLGVPAITRHGVVQKGSSGPMMVALHPTANQAWVASEEAGVVTTFDTKQWKVLGYTKAGTAPDPLAFLP